MTDLVSWLTQQIDYDEDVAEIAIAARRDAFGDEVTIVYEDGVGGYADTVLQDPARVLRQVAAYRRILSRHTTTDSGVDEDGKPWTITYCGHCNDPGPCGDVRDLLSIYSDREGYDPSWTVE